MLSVMIGRRSKPCPDADEDAIKTLIQALSRRFEALPKTRRILLAGVLVIFGLYGSIDFGAAIGRALYHFTH